MDKKIFKDISYGVYIVSTKDKNNRSVGCVINSLTQVTSIDPLISISLNKDNYTNIAIKENKSFSISILSVETPKTIIGTFGYQSSKDIDKYEFVNHLIENNIPVLNENICGYLTAECLNIIECNTHDIIIAKVLNTNKTSNLEPMTYKYYQENLKGTSPKKAPTYIEEETKNKDHKKYKCPICGYIHDEIEEKIKFEDLPNDWKCPLCGVPKSQFKEIK